MRLAGVLHDRKLVPVGDLHDGVHIRHLAVQVHRHDCLGARSDGGLEKLWIHRVRALVDVDEHRLGAAIADRFGGRHEGRRDRDHFIAGSNSERQQRQPKRVRAIADSDGVSRAAECGETLLEALDERSAGERVLINHLFNRGQELRPDWVVLGTQIEERDVSRGVH